MLVQRNGDEAGWPDRLVIEHNILWDILVAQARNFDKPPLEPVHIDPKKVKKLDLSHAIRRHRRFG